VLIDLSATEFVDPANIDVINAFVRNDEYRGIRIQLRGDLSDKAASQIKAPTQKVAFV
jgi:carbonic anhydrase